MDSGRLAQPYSPLCLSYMACSSSMVALSSLSTWSGLTG